MTRPALRRSLSLRDLVVYGMLFIGPLAPVGVFGILDARMGGAVALIYALATVAMAFTAWSYAEMSRVVPHAGSVFAYASHGIGPRAGFLAGWLAMLDYLLIPSVAFLFSGIALHALVPAVPAWVFTVAAFAVATSCNLLGVGVAARVGTAVVVLEVAVLGLFLAGGTVFLVRHGPLHAWSEPFVGATTPGMSAIGGALSIAVLSYLGFDAIAAFAEESAGDPRTIGRAILLCLAGSGALFVAQTYLAALVSPFAGGVLAAHPDRQGAAFYEITRVAIGPGGSTLMAATKAVGPAFAAMTAQAAAARLLFGMARDGRLPRALAAVDARRGVPRAALLGAAALTLGVSVWAARRPDGLDVLVSVVDIGALGAFTLLHASTIGFFVHKRRADRRAAHVMVPAAGALVTVWVMAEASTLAKLVGLLWLAAGVAALRFGPGAVPSSHSATFDGDAPRRPS